MCFVPLLKYSITQSFAHSRRVYAVIFMIHASMIYHRGSWRNYFVNVGSTRMPIVIRLDDGNVAIRATLWWTSSNILIIPGALLELSLLQLPREM